MTDGKVCTERKKENTYWERYFVVYVVYHVEKEDDKHSKVPELADDEPYQRGANRQEYKVPYIPKGNVKRHTVVNHPEYLQCKHA